MVIRINDKLGSLRVRDDLLAIRFGSTAADWEEAANPEDFVELLDGRLIMHSPVSLIHAELFGFLHWLLKGFVDARGLGKVLAGPFTMDLSEDRKFEPDIMFLAKSRLGSLQPDRVSGPADLAIEIASPSTATYDRTEKREAYRVGGIREYWMIDPYQHSILVDRPAGHEAGRFTEGIVAAQLCPGFFIRAEWLWADPLPQVQTCLSEILSA